MYKELIDLEQITFILRNKDRILLRDFVNPIVGGCIISSERATEYFREFSKGFSSQIRAEMGFRKYLIENQFNIKAINRLMDSVEAGLPYGESTECNISLLLVGQPPKVVSEELYERLKHLYLLEDKQECINILQEFIAQRARVSVTILATAIISEIGRRDQNEGRTKTV